MERSKSAVFLNTMRSLGFKGPKIPSDVSKSSKTNADNTPADYRKYIPSAKERRDYYICGAMVCIVLGMLFYDSMIGSAVLFILVPFFEKKYLEHLTKKRSGEITEGFKDALYSISASIASGRQLPRAIEDAAGQSAVLYGEESIIAMELSSIARTYYQTNQTIEGLLKDFAERTGISEIMLFASSCEICRKCGGDLESVCLKSAYMIIEKIDFSQEAGAMLAEKKLDIIILMAMPLIVLFFLSMNSYDYIEVLYASLKGRVIMTLSLLMMAAASLWSLKIMSVKV